MKTDTPRTDAAEPQLYSNAGGWVKADFPRELERKLAESQAEVEFWKAKAYEAEEMEGKHEAEVERLTKRPFGCKCETLREKALGDGCDECNKALVIEMLTDERHELEAEIEHIKKLLKDPSAVHINTLRGTIAGLSWDGYEHILGPHPCRERAEKAEAEVERLSKLTEDCLNVIRVYCPTYYNDAMERFNKTNKMNYRIIKTRCGKHFIKYKFLWFWFTNHPFKGPTYMDSLYHAELELKSIKKYKAAKQEIVYED